MLVRTAISRSQLADLFGIEPYQLVGVESTVTGGWEIVMEEDEMQVTGTFPQLASNTSYGTHKGGSAKTPKKTGGKK